MCKIIVIAGPTAVGKTKLSLYLAKRYNAEIINADAMQVYKEMNIGTAKIIDTMGIKHHLLSIKSVCDSYSSYEYQKDARKILNRLIENKGNVIIVGGTGLYIKALLYDYNFDLETTYNEYKELSNEEILNKIKQINNSVDIHINNRKRLVRMLNKLTNNNKISNNGDVLLYKNVYFIGLTMDRNMLYDRINKRVDEMIDEGLIDEVKSLYDKKLNTIPINTAIGYKELYMYFDNLITKEEAIDLIKKNSRHYAKRQYTWFNNKMDIKWFNTDIDNFDNTINNVIKYIDM